jgi:hypothetical protein
LAPSWRRWRRWKSPKAERSTLRRRRLRLHDMTDAFVAS